MTHFVLYSNGGGFYFSKTGIHHVPRASPVEGIILSRPFSVNRNGYLLYTHYVHNNNIMRILPNTYIHAMAAADGFLGTNNIYLLCALRA